MALPCETCGRLAEEAREADAERSVSSESLSSTSTHPSSTAPVSYYNEFQDFLDQAKDALDGAYPSSDQPRNSRIGVLLLSFTEDIGALGEIEALQEVFESNYRYETESWLIPTDEPELALFQKIFQFRRKFCQSNREANSPLPLLIVYYNGNSARPSPGRNACEWLSQAEGPYASVNWTNIQPILFDALADVLVILDCSYASSAAWRAGTNDVGTKEILAASGPDSTAAGVGVESFTAALTHELKSQATKRDVLTSVALHGRLLQAGYRLKFQPVYARSDRTSRYSAALVPFPARIPDPFSAGVNRSTRFLGSGTRVVLVIHLRGDPTDELLGFLRNQCALPISVTGMHIERVDRMIGAEASFRGTSTVVIVSLPVAAWHLLPDHEGCRFIAMITGPNLLAGGDRVKLENPLGSLRNEEDRDDAKEGKNKPPKRPSSVASDSGFESEGDIQPPPYPTTGIARDQQAIDIYLSENHPSVKPDPRTSGTATRIQNAELDDLIISQEDRDKAIRSSIPVDPISKPDEDSQPLPPAPPYSGLNALEDPIPPTFTPLARRINIKTLPSQAHTKSPPPP